MAAQAAGTQAAVALVVDDEPVSRTILRQMLVTRGYEVLEAEDGAAGVRAFAQTRVDVVFMDVVMPVMDGYEASRRIKVLAGDRFVPLIFVTGHASESSLDECVEAGADDFYSKPFDPHTLDARLRALERSARLYETMRAQRDRLREHQARFEQDQRVAEAVMARFQDLSRERGDNVRHSLKPAALFNGDLLLMARLPNGTQRILLGDVTGHGLPAAVCAIPLEELFRTLAARGEGLAVTARALNARLNAVVPDGVFMAAAIVDLDYRARIVSVWNGGLPAVHLTRSGEGIVGHFRSNHVPMAVLDDALFDPEPRTAPFELGDRLWLHTDGVVDLPDAGTDAEEQFEAVIAAAPEEESIAHVVQRMALVRGAVTSHDDAAVVEVRCVAPVLGHDATVHESPSAGAWSYRVRLERDALRRTDLIPLIAPMVAALVPDTTTREMTMTVVGELYTNALDHGVLQISSELKDCEGGFSCYLAARSRALEELADGRVEIELESRPGAEGGALFVRVGDSGRGFDRRTIPRSSDGLSGRGIALVEGICESVQWNESGNEVQAVLSW